MPRKPHARIFLVDDNDLWRNAAREILDDAGHAVVAEAGSLDEVRDLLERVRTLGANIAIVDANLGASHDGRDLARVIDLLDEAKLSLTVISCSGYGEQFAGVVHVQKGAPCSWRQLVAAVNDALVPG